MFELMLDTANLKEITLGLTAYPISGITSNPSILKKEGNIDVFAHLGAIKALCGSRSLNVQVVSASTEDIVREAHFILDRLGKDTYIKIPVSAAGLPAIKTLAQNGVNVTATAIYSTMQGILSVLSGAKCLAVYYNRMENNNVDPKAVIGGIRQCIDDGGYDAKIIAASFKNVGQVVNAYASGAKCATVPLDILALALGMACIDSAVDGFAKDFEAVHGSGKTMLHL